MDYKVFAVFGVYLVLFLIPGVFQEISNNVLAMLLAFRLIDAGQHDAEILLEQLNFRAAYLFFEIGFVEGLLGRF